MALAFKENRVLVSLHIRNLALVEKLEIDFYSGLNVVTGETGAGKSVILGAIRLLMGGRADKSLIRHGATRAELSAVLDLSDSPYLLESAAEILSETGLSMEEDGQLILRRTITASSSRNYVNSSPVTVKTLRALGACFIDICAPGEQQGLADNSKQRLLLDRFAGLQDDVSSVSKAYRIWQDLIEELEGMKSGVPDRGEAEILRYQFDEIEDVKIDLVEDAGIYKLHKQLSGAQDLMRLSQGLTYKIDGEENSLIPSMQLLMREMHELSSIDDENGERFIESLEGCLENLRDLFNDIDSYGSRLVLDGEELLRVEERLNSLELLKRKYGPELSDVLVYQEKLNSKLDLVERYDDILAEKYQDVERAEKQYLNLCQRLSKKRQDASVPLGEQITKELYDLEFHHCQFEVQVSKKSPSASGFDHVEYLFAPNAGEGLNALKDVASSGEIARVMLAVKTVLAEVDRVPVLIFDEIDANIGGRVATAVARKLHQLGCKHQIFCITHMPQVAAAGQEHYVVEKKVIEGRTITAMTYLEKGERIDEISRMLGGSELSSAAESHAEELMLAVRR